VPTRRASRGVGEAVAALIGLSVVVLVALFALISLPPHAPIKPATERLVAYPSERLVVYPSPTSSNVWCADNVGSTVVRVEYLKVLAPDFGELVLRASQNGICSVSSGPVVEPGSTLCVMCSEGYTVVSLITSSGRVFSVDPSIYVLRQTAIGVPMEPLLVGVYSTASLLQFISDPGTLVEGSVQTYTTLTQYLNISNVDVSSSLRASLVIVGVNPASGRLNLLIAGKALSGDSITVAGSAINLGAVAGVRYRLKIEDFDGTVMVGGVNAAPGVYPCYVNSGTQCLVSLSGVAARLTLYVANTSSPGSLGLDPYTFVGDLDGNGAAETLLVTQDFGVGDKSTVNDRESDKLYLDQTLKPLRLIFTQKPVNSSKYATAVLSIKMFYWDSSLDDIEDNDNRVVMRVGLYDPDTESFVYSVYLSYYELCRYRGVRPFSVSYIAKDFILYVPLEGQGKVYYVAIELYDPFLAEGGRNDAEVLIGLEYVGIVLGVRP